MIFEYLNFALICLTVFFVTLIFAFYRSTKYKIFDNRNFSKKLYSIYFLTFDVVQPNIFAVSLMSYAGFIF